MRCKHQPRADIVTCEDKVQVAKEFILDYMKNAGRQPQMLPAMPHCFLLLARSPESPVAAAVAQLSRDISAAGIKVRAIFSSLGNSKCALSWTTAGLDIEFAREIRWARDRALLDAHEQLVLGPAMIWTGDSMRREPSRPDAYQCYGIGQADAVHYAAVSFERLWKICVPVVTHGDPDSAPDGDECVAGAAVAAELAMLDEITGEDGSGAATRH